MKKVKIMLTAITVFAVVGGALAFKVKGTDAIWQKSGSTCPQLITDVQTASSQLTNYIQVTNATFVDPSGDASQCNTTFFYTTTEN